MRDATGDILERAARLSCWTAPGTPSLLGGGKTNHNVLIADGARKYVVRFGRDIPEHGILRWNELAITRAAETAGLGPAVVHAEPGILVMEFVEAEPVTRDDLTQEGAVEELARLLQRVHRDMPRHLGGPVLCFWVFHIVRDYARFLRGRASPYCPLLPDLLMQAEEMERLVGPTPVVLGHNDLLPGNILKGQGRFWLIDWEYAGFGSPLFDLGGLASNNGFSPDEERRLLGAYDGVAPDAARLRQYAAMKAASLLRETLWSMVSELTSAIDFDYADYTATNLAAYRQAFAALQSM